MIWYDLSFKLISNVGRERAGLSNLGDTTLYLPTFLYSTCWLYFREYVAPPLGFPVYVCGFIAHICIQKLCICIYIYIDIYPHTYVYIYIYGFIYINTYLPWILVMLVMFTNLANLVTRSRGFPLGSWGGSHRVAEAGIPSDPWGEKARENSWFLWIKRAPTIPSGKRLHSELENHNLWSSVNQLSIGDFNQHVGTWFWLLIWQG